MQPHLFISRLPSRIYGAKRGRFTKAIHGIARAESSAPFFSPFFSFIDNEEAIRCVVDEEMNRGFS